MVFNRRRGTAIVEFPEGILVVSQGSESFMLAGGGASKGESRRKAAMRELQEETGLKPLDSKYLFSYKGFCEVSIGFGVHVKFRRMMAILGSVKSSSVLFLCQFSSVHLFSVS